MVCRAAADVGAVPVPGLAACPAIGVGEEQIGVGVAAAGTVIAGVARARPFPKENWNRLLEGVPQANTRPDRSGERVLFGSWEGIAFPVRISGKTLAKKIFANQNNTQNPRRKKKTNSAIWGISGKQVNNRSGLASHGTLTRLKDSHG
jgi:hypothetical protein